MADDVTDVASDISPDEFMADEQESPKAESSPAKPEAKAEKAEEKPEKAKAEEKPKQETPEEPKEEAKSDEEQPQATPEEEAETEEKPAEKPTKADERKNQLNTEIRDLVAQRNALKEQVAKANSEVYQPATEDDLVDEGMSATDAKVEALRQEIEMRNYNEKVADAQLTIESEANRVLQEFSVFNPDSTDYDEELSLEASQLLDANLIRDPNTNQIIGSNVSPYQIYKTLARAQGISTAKGQIKGQQATEQMLANADNTASAAPPKKTVDPVLSLWEDPL